MQSGKKLARLLQAVGEVWGTARSALTVSTALGILRREWLQSRRWAGAPLPRIKSITTRQERQDWHGDGIPVLDIVDPDLNPHYREGPVPSWVDARRNELRFLEAAANSTFSPSHVPF